MAAVSQLGYVVVGASNISEWAQFAADILGLRAEEAGDDNSLLLRMDEYHHRLIIEPGNDDVAVIGWQVADESELEAVGERLQANGVEVHVGTQPQADARQVVRLIRFRDPNGIESEAFCGPLVQAEGPFVSPRAISGFVTEGMGLGHITMTVDSLEQSLHFYCDLLGMRITDWVHTQREFGLAAFLRCNRRHHSLGMGQAEFPKRLSHIMLQAKSIDDVGTTYDLCQDRGAPIVRGLGRHANDRMFSFYLESPSGFLIEYGWGGREIDDSTWRVEMHRRTSMWGHRPVARKQEA